MVRSASALALLASIALACNMSGDVTSESTATVSTSTEATATMTMTMTMTSSSPTEAPTTSEGPTTSTSEGSGTSSTTAAESTGATTGTTTTGTGSDSDTDTDSDTTGDLGPMVDLSDPQLYSFEFRADEADPEASEALAIQLGYLDTQVTPRGKLVVYLHGAGAPEVCGSKAHGQVLAGMGFHVFSPCYRSDYGIGNCGDDIGGCRLEAFEGVDHHDFIDITPPNSAELRIVKGLHYLQEKNPEGDWTYYLDGEQPRWDRIIISGISHGASSSGVIGMNRVVDRVVMLSGPLDTDQAWLKGQPMTELDRFYGFTHTDDDQHPGHLAAFSDMNLVGEPTPVDDAAPPYGDSHRLVSSAATQNGHGAVQAGGSSPKDGDDNYLYMPVWETLYGVKP